MKALILSAKTTGAKKEPRSSFRLRKAPKRSIWETDDISSVKFYRELMMIDPLPSFQHILTHKTQYTVVESSSTAPLFLFLAQILLSQQPSRRRRLRLHTFMLLLPHIYFNLSLLTYRHEHLSYVYVISGAGLVKLHS